MAKADRMPGGRLSTKSLAAKSHVRSNYDTVGRDWASWVKTWRNWFICSIWAGSLPEPEVEFYMPAKENALSRPFTLRLTEFTEPEIIALKELFDKLFDLAIPICKARDERAAASYEAGEDADKRLYRSAPSVFTRAWAVGVDGASLLQRLADLPSTKQFAERTSERAGVGGDALVEPDASDRQPEDDDSPGL